MAKLTARSAAARAIHAVLKQHLSLSAVLPPLLEKLNDNERSLCQHLCYGVLRWQHQLAAISAQLLDKPMKAKDGDITALLHCGLYQLREMRIPDHAAISETVSGCKGLGKPWARGLLNACLRQYQRRTDEINATLSKNPVAEYAHPDWLITAYQQDWPEQWQAILTANNQPPPMFLRVNQQRTTRDDYLQQLAAADITAEAVMDCPQGILLETPCPVGALPNFAEGWVSVQDGAAQRVIDLLDIQPQQHILDACAAPGGKTCHILETQPDNTVVALDIAPERLERIHENTARLGLSVKTLAADAADTDQWWDGKKFDRILIDAPCSGTGVVRRHPDIKHLRREDDIAALAETQRNLLEALWPLLADDGILVYTTCSALKQENTLQVTGFLSRHPETEIQSPPQAPATPCGNGGYQRLPGDDLLDGFYYAALRHR